MLSRRESCRLQIGKMKVSSYFYFFFYPGDEVGIRITLLAGSGLPEAGVGLSRPSGRGGVRLQRAGRTEWCMW